ncbi:MAG: response regulator [Patescibacteria group bacterium]|jgi:two-component system alkaline phosphatase synthesis response regulator PhoP
MKKILIIDDDNNIIKMYLVKLRNSGYEVIYAINGQQGLEMALQNHPDLIVLDLAMPVMDGMAVIKKLREDAWGKTAPVIILTNYDTDDKAIIDIQKTQPSYYLLKTNNTPNEVVEKIDELLKVENKL